MIAADSKYSGVVAFAAMAHNPTNGNPGIALTLKCDDGEIETTLWITGNTIDRVKKTLTELGVKAEQLQNPDTLSKLNDILQGAACKFTTKIGSKGDVEVQWLNGAHGRAPVPPAVLVKAAALFGGAKPKPSAVDDFGDFGVGPDDVIDEPPHGF